jgi:hypothetical protein
MKRPAYAGALGDYMRLLIDDCGPVQMMTEPGGSDLIVYCAKNPRSWLNANPLLFGITGMKVEVLQ